MEKIVDYETLLHFTREIFLAIGCPAEDAATAATALLSADLRGVDSHGIARLAGYVRLWDAQRVNAKPDIKILHEMMSTAVLDGDAGLGLVVAPAAMQLAIAKAGKTGSGWVSVQNSNHFGIAGYHAMMALPHDMIGIAMTNASALVAPTFSKEKMLGTNPIAVAIPAGEEPPFVADFATTTASNGKLELLQQKKQDAPDRWVQTDLGMPSNEADILKRGGAMLPLGGDREHGSHKGYMLGSIVDIFCGVLSGANFGPWVPPFPAYLPMPVSMPGKGIGHFFGAMKIDCFRPAAAFKSDMDQWIRAFKNAASINPGQPVIIPGEPERASEVERLQKGIAIPATLKEELSALGKRFSITPGF